MNHRRDRLYDSVRQATELSPEQTAALGDLTTRSLLLEEILRMDTADQPSPQPAPQRRRRLLAVAAAATVAVAALALVAALGWWRPAGQSSAGQPLQSRSIPPTQASSAASTPAGQPQGDLFSGQMSGSCVEDYNQQTLARRSFAADATVLSIGAPASDAEQGGDPYVAVVLHVNHWYRGGPGDHLTVAMFPPQIHTSAGNVTYSVGSRLLVSGEDRRGNRQLTDPVSWACGFTRWYSTTDAPTWAAAFR